MHAGHAAYACPHWVAYGMQLRHTDSASVYSQQHDQHSLLLLLLLLLRCSMYRFTTIMPTVSDVMLQDERLRCCNWHHASMLSLNAPPNAACSCLWLNLRYCSCLRGHATAKNSCKCLPPMEGNCTNAATTARPPANVAVAVVTLLTHA
jgi:hypothetical protein